MGVSVALVVTVSMAAAITLLPGLLGLAGTKIDKLSIHRKSHVTKPAHETLSGRWAHHVGSHSVRYAIVSLGVLCAIAVPALSMRIGAPDDGNAAKHTTQRTAYDELAKGFGPGFNGPIQVVVEVPELGRPQRGRPRPRRAAGRSRDQRGYRAGLQRRRRHRGAHRQPDHLTAGRAHRRARPSPPVRRAAGDGRRAPTRRVSLTGRAMATDLTDRIASRLPIFIVAIVAMSFLLLMIVFRSLLVPLKAALMNLLSIAAAYGVLVAVFQWGWGNELIGLHSTMPINPFLPLIMFAILFGLSMDYEVFLLSRVREEYVATGDNHAAVVRGLSSTARVITSAALIMISVFGAFVLTDDPNGKLFGVGLAVAVFIDATLIRMVLVPATMTLDGPGQLVAPGLARPDPAAPRPRGRAQEHRGRRASSPSASSPPPDPVRRAQWRYRADLVQDDVERALVLTSG